MSYIGVYAEASVEKVIEKSRFIAYAARTVGEEEARSFLGGLRARHPTATHVCYGFIADDVGNMQRFSDDGEPQGTAGMPILGVIKAQNLKETTVAVVRYFGGIKLGAGGLTRAYASSAAEVLSVSEKRCFDLSAELLVTVNYPDVGALLRFLEGSGASTVGIEYGERAAATVAVRENGREKFCKDLINTLCGRVQIEPKRCYLYPFEME